MQKNNISVENRRKTFIVSQKYSHHIEVHERLQFIQYLASVSDFQISKKQLAQIYELLVIKSSINSDYEEFLIWCKRSCEQSSNDVTILDLNEVGEFFIEKMSNGQLDLEHLILVGFDFLSQYFLSVNEKGSKLLKAAPKKKEKQNAQQMAAFNLQ